MNKLVLILLLLPLLYGCGAIYAYRTMQIQTDRQAILRMYRECLEEHKGDPEAIEKYCTPLIAPLRINIKEQ